MFKERISKKILNNLQKKELLEDHKTRHVWYEGIARGKTIKKNNVPITKELVQREHFDIVRQMLRHGLNHNFVDTLDTVSLLGDRVKTMNMIRGVVLDNAKGKGVPGTGHLDSVLFIVGQNPGKTEIKTGKPFVGKAGRMLKDILRASNFPENKIYFTNSIKKGDRTSAEDMEFWKPILMLEIKTINPKYVISFGTTALKAVGKVAKRGFPQPSYMMRFIKPESQVKIIAEAINKIGKQTGVIPLSDPWTPKFLYEKYKTKMPHPPSVIHNATPEKIARANEERLRWAEEQKEVALKHTEQYVAKKWWSSWRKLPAMQKETTIELLGKATPTEALKIFPYKEILGHYLKEAEGLIREKAVGPRIKSRMLSQIRATKRYYK